MTTVYVITCGSSWPGIHFALEAAQAAGLAAAERVSVPGEWQFRWEQGGWAGEWLLTRRHVARPAGWVRTGRSVRHVELGLAGAPREALWGLVADALTELSRRDIPITVRSEGESYIGPNVYDGIRPARPGHCVVLADDGRWVVEDRTPRCAECGEPLPYPGMSYCSTRCNNAADRHNDLDGGL